MEAATVAAEACGHWLAFLSAAVEVFPVVCTTFPVFSAVPAAPATAMAVDKATPLAGTVCGLAELALVVVDATAVGVIVVALIRPAVPVEVATAAVVSVVLLQAV